MRARGIKPGFFTDEDLLDLDPLVRLFFIGLWLVADRRGRLEDKPRQLKIQLMPCDELDTDQALDSLARSGFVIRYAVDGARYIQVVNFEKHQNPHKNERESTIPAPCSHGACTVGLALTPDSCSLTPDSGLLTPEERGRDENAAPQASAVEKHPRRNGKPPDTTPGQRLVASYVDAYTDKHEAQPSTRLRGQWAATIADMVRLGHPEELVAEAITACVEQGKGPSVLELKIGDLRAKAPPDAAREKRRFAREIAERAGPQAAQAYCRTNDIDWGEVSRG